MERDLLLCFGQPAIPGCVGEDINEDGNVNVLDLIQLLLHFGEVCKDVCDGAVAIGLGFFTNTTVEATLDNAPQCIDQVILVPVPIVAPGVWYSLIGDGSILTATTCSVTTIGFDTAISVYCGPCNNLFCVGGSLDDFNCPVWIDASSVTWCSVLDQEYLILVHGDGLLAAGPFGLEIASGGAGCPPTPPCP